MTLPTEPLNNLEKPVGGWRVRLRFQWTPINTFLVLGGVVTLLRILTQQIPTFTGFEWRYVGYVVYYVFFVTLWVVPALWLVRSGRHNFWEWLLCLPPILWCSYGVTTMDRPAAPLLILPLVVRHRFGLRPAIVSGVIFSALAAYVFQDYAKNWGQNTCGVSIKDTLINFFLALFQGVFSFTAYELAVRNQQKQQQLEAALHALEGYRGLELENTALQERTRLSRELHDSLGHQLTVMRVESQKSSRLMQKAGLEQPQLQASLQLLVERSGEAFTQLQDIVSTLRETELDGTLFQAVEQLVQNWPGEVQLNIQGQEPNLNSAARLALYRAIQECLTNAYKYASGQPVLVEIGSGESQLTLCVRNRLKVGAAPPLVEWLSGGTGLPGLQKRIEELGGQMIVTRTQEMFEVCLTLPL